VTTVKPQVRIRKRGIVMRAATFVFALLLALAAPAAGQEWTEYQNNQDGFKVDFPG